MIDVGPYHAHDCRVMMRILAAELVKSALSGLPRHVACHVGIWVEMCVGMKVSRRYGSFEKRRKEKADGGIL